MICDECHVYNEKYVIHCGIAVISIIFLVNTIDKD